MQVTRTIWLRRSRCDDFIRACRRDQIEGRRALSCGQPNHPPLRLLRSTPAGPTTRSPGERHLDPPFDHDIAPDHGQSRSWLGRAGRQWDVIARLKDKRTGEIEMRVAHPRNPSQRSTSSPCTLPPSLHHVVRHVDARPWVVACLHANAVPRWRAACGPQLDMTGRLQVDTTYVQTIPFVTAPRLTQGQEY